MKIEQLGSLYDFKYKILLKEHLQNNSIKHLYETDCDYTGFLIGSILCIDCSENISGKNNIIQQNKTYFLCKQKLLLKLNYKLQYLNSYKNSYTYEQLEILSKYA